MPTHDESIEIAVDHDSISATFITPSTLIPGVFFVHGWGGSQSQYLARAREIAALGCICLTFDPRGHAETRRQYGNVSREHNLRDLLAAPGRPRRDRVGGSSYGGYLGANLTSMRPVKWLALRAPALYIDTGWESPKLQLHKDQDLKHYRQGFVPAAENRALRACRDFKGDVLLVESEFDSIIPAPVLTSCREACKQARSLTCRCVAGADHGLTAEADQRSYTALLAGWVSEMVAGARVGRPAPKVAESEIALPESPPEEV